MDILIRAGEPMPQPGKRILARHPFDAKKRAYVTPSVVIPLLRLVFKGAGVSSASVSVPPAFALAEGAGEDLRKRGEAGSGPSVGGGGGGGGGGSGLGSGEGVALRAPTPALIQKKEFIKGQMKLFRTDILRPLNPTPYKVSTSPELYHYLHDLLMVRGAAAHSIFSLPSGFPLPLLPVKALSRTLSRPNTRPPPLLPRRKSSPSLKWSSAHRMLLYYFLKN